MKKINKIFFLLITLFINVIGFAKENPPPPNQRNAGSPPGEEVPIDNHIYWLIVLALVFGFYILTKPKSNLQNS